MLSKRLFRPVRIAGFIVGSSIALMACVTGKPLHPDGGRKPVAYYTDTVTAPPLPGMALFFHDTLLVSLLKEAVYNNYDALIADQGIQAAGARMLAARAPLAPTVGIGSYASNIRYGYNTMDGLGNATTPGVPQPIVPSYMLGVSSSWEPDLWGRLRGMKRAARHRYLASQMGRAMVSTRIVSDVAYRYYELVSLRDELDIIHRNIALQTEALEIMKIQKLSGKVTELAVQQFSAQLRHTHSMEYAVRRNVARVTNELNMLRGGLPDSVRTAESIFSEKMPGIVHAGVPAQLLYNRPDIMAAASELSAAAADADVARAALFPSLNITAHLGLNSFYPGTLFDPAALATGLVANITGPLINRRQLKSAHLEALAQNKAAWYRYQSKVLGAVYEVRYLMSAISNQEQQLLFLQQESATLTEAIEIAKDLYIGGYASYLEVITAQKSALEAELNALHARKELFFSNVDLYRALGGGWQ